MTEPLVPRVVGYTDPWAVRAGDALELMVSAPAAFEASVVALDGPRNHRQVASPIDGRYEAAIQPLRRGSYVAVRPAPAVGASFALQAWIQPTRPGPGAQALIALGDPERAGGFAWLLDADGRLALAAIEDGAPAPRLVHPRALTIGRWHFVAASVDAERDELRLWVAELDRSEPVLHEATGAGAEGLRPPPEAGELLIAAARVRDADGGPPLPAHHFNGKLDTPRVFAAPLTPAAVAELLAGPITPSAPPLAGAWRLGPERAIVDVSGGGTRAEAVNLPTSAVTGWNWTGDATDPAVAPEQYGALHFHDDGLGDADWTPSVRLTVPGEWESGIYAVRVEAAEEVDHVPFFVEPRPGEARADVALLVPTFSYLAYGNESDTWTYLDPSERPELGPRDRYIAEHGLLGLYERYSDGSGVSLVSRRRPIANMRPDYVIPITGTFHQLSADLDLVAWLRARGTAHDVLTDETLHREGAARLAEYRVVLTGSHPEYWSVEMLRAVERYLQDGGRLMYLGGNGAYWVTSVDPDAPWMIEVRRGFAGTRTWSSAPGEEHHATTGELGGLWRHRGWAPQRLFGVGFAGQGHGDGGAYRIAAEAARDPRCAFVFDGVDLDAPLGARSTVLGAAASLELDRHDVALGSSPDALVLASATEFATPYELCHEEVWMGPTAARGDIVLTSWPNGGAVFSVGSIGWCGGLLVDDGESDIACVTGNVLDAFRGEATPWLGEPT